MIILFGDKEEVDRYFSLLNITKQFDKDVYLIYREMLSKIKDIRYIFNQSNKVFICQSITSKKVLKIDLLSSGCPNSKICFLNEDKARFSFMMHDLNYTTANHKILSGLLCDFNNISRLYTNFIQSYYNQENKLVDVLFDFHVPNHYDHIIDLSKAMKVKYTTINCFLNKPKTKIKNTLILDSQDRTHASTQMVYLNNYKVLVSTNGAKHPTATTVHMLHTMIQKPVSRYHIFREYAGCNYILMTTKDMFEKTKDILEEYKYLLTREVCLVPFGYVKLDKIKYDLQKQKKFKRKAICYAPTILKHTKEFLDTLSLSNGELIIEVLLENFKDYDIIFRPHPDTLINNAGIEYVNNIIQKYTNHKRFIYDESNYYIEMFARTEIMITDFSSIGQTFTFSTLKPLLSLSKEGFDEQYRKVFKKDDIRKNYGLVLNNIDELSQKIQYMIDNKKEFKNKIKKYRKEQVFNYGKSVDYFVNNFDYIRDKKKHPDWFYIGKNNVI